MNANQLIKLAESKGYAVSRYKSNIYEWAYFDGAKHVNNRFNGTWQEFVKFMQEIKAPMTFTLEHKLCDTNPASQVPEAIWDAVFSFNAVNEKDADNKAHSWARYHSFSGNDVRIRPATAHESEHWMHNEWVD